MTSIIFLGRVFPLKPGMTVRKHPPIAVQDQHSDFTMLFDISIRDGQITVDCDVENYSHDKHYISCLVRAIDLVNASVNLLAFKMGLGVTVVIERSIEEDGSHRAISLRDLLLGSLVTAFSPDDESFDVVLEFVFQDLRLSRAIRDLTESIGGPHLIPTNCARAIETIRSIMLPANVDRKLGWKYLRDNLRATEGYIKLITDNGVGPRHGDLQYVAGDVTRVIATRSWILMTRFFEYLKRGKQPLPLADFPILSE
jgi:hypothetical protein